MACVDAVWSYLCWIAKHWSYSKLFGNMDANSYCHSVITFWRTSTKTGRLKVQYMIYCSTSFHHQEIFSPFSNVLQSVKCEHNLGANTTTDTCRELLLQEDCCRLPRVQRTQFIAFSKVKFLAGGKTLDKVPGTTKPLGRQTSWMEFWWYGYPVLASFGVFQLNWFVSTTIEPKCYSLPSSFPKVLWMFGEMCLWR